MSRAFFAAAWSDIHTAVIVMEHGKLGVNHAVSRNLPWEQGGIVFYVVPDE